MPSVVAINRDQVRAHDGHCRLEGGEVIDLLVIIFWRAISILLRFEPKSTR